MRGLVYYSNKKMTKIIRKTKKKAKKNQIVDKSRLSKINYWTIKIIGLTMILAVFFPLFYKSHPLVVFLFAPYIIVGLYFLLVTHHHLPANILFLAYGIVFIGLALHLSGPPISLNLLKDLKDIWVDPMWEVKAKVIFTTQTIDKILWLCGVIFLLLSDIFALAEKTTGIEINIKKIFKFPISKASRR